MSGLEISRSHAPEFSRKTMVVIGGSHNVVSDCKIFTVPDISEWILDDWLTKPSSDFSLSGARRGKQRMITSVSKGIDTG